MPKPPLNPTDRVVRAPTFLRLSAGLVYFYFGFLKFYTDLSPAEMLASQTIMRLWPWPVDAHTVLLWLAASEVLIGVAFLLNVGLRWVLWIFLLHQVGTFSPLFFMPELSFKIAPFSPTMEGQFIIKNLVSLAVGLTVMLPAVRAASVARHRADRAVDSAATRRGRRMRPSFQRAAVGLGIVVIAAGIHVTYERYRGTELSRVPSFARHSNDRFPDRDAVTSAHALTTDPAAPDPLANPSPPAAGREIPRAADDLRIYPTVERGFRTPFDLWRYYGRGASSFDSPIMPMRFEQWLEFHRKQKPVLMREVKDYMASRYDFSGAPLAGAAMTGGKAIMNGPIARLPREVDSFEELAMLSAAEIRERDLFPFKPLAHPLSSTAHMVFPDSWIRAHPEHDRIDVAMDIPDAYLPEFPPPLFLTTHKELGDVTNGIEITLDNYYEIFDGLLTPEQMEGLKELLRPSPTTWFNQTDHRVTRKPSRGVACFDCHVNGHSNGAFELAPDSRPHMGRLRVDTPSMRGNYNLMQLASKRSVRSMDHFAEIEEYFDGDPGMMQAIGPRAVKRDVSNRMGDFNAIIDYPPAPKLDVLGRLRKELATPAELRGEELFHGKAHCVQCHHGPSFVDDYLHDLQVERFYAGRPEGPIKTFPLRGIKDSPPYLHDGRCPTLHDVVEFFDLVLALRLTAAEKDDLVAFLLCL